MAKEIDQAALQSMVASIVADAFAKVASSLRGANPGIRDTERQASWDCTGPKFTCGEYNCTGVVGCSGEFSCNTKFSG